MAKNKKPRNRGLFYERTSFNEGYNREKIFADEWEKANEPDPHVNFGNGIAQDLLITGPPLYNPMLSPIMIYKLTRRERIILATIVQWLGSNVGWGFLTRCVNLCGYKLVKTEKETEGREGN